MEEGVSKTKQKPADLFYGQSILPGHKKLRLAPIKQSVAKKISDQKCRGMDPNGAYFTSK